MDKYLVVDTDRIGEFDYGEHMVLWKVYYKKCDSNGIPCGQRMVEYNVCFDDGTAEVFKAKKQAYRRCGLIIH